MHAGAGPNPGTRMMRRESSETGGAALGNARRIRCLPACIEARCGCKVRPEMAPRPASRPAPRARASAFAPLAVGTFAGLLAYSLPRVAAAEPPARDSVLEPGPELTLDQPPPPSARTYTIVGGLATTATWYGLALGSSYLWPDTIGAKDLRIPVAGPWIAFSHSGCGGVADCHDALVVVRAIATALDGIGQLGGLMITGQGLFLSTSERKPPRARASWRSLRGYGVEMQPTFDAGKNTVGFGVVGVF